MTFDEIWNDIELDTYIKISDGNAPPSTNTSGLPYRIWKSHNFSGMLKEKINQNGWRYLRFELDPDENGNIIGYLISESVEHTFNQVE